MNLEGKKVLLTGGSGFLGRVIKRKLLLKDVELFAPRSSEMNMLDFRQVLEYFTEVDPEIVIHSGAYYGGLGINRMYPAEIFFQNTLFYAHILEASKLVDAKKVVMVGTACSYPDGLEILKEEDLWSGAVHKSVQNYGGVKKMMQIGIESYKNQYGMDGIHVLLANLYGEWDSYNPERSHVVSALIRKFVEAKMFDRPEVGVWGTGRPIREFLYVEDAGEGIVRATEMYDDISPLNIGTGIGTSIKELVNLIAYVTEYNGKIVWESDKPDGQYKKIFSTEKMERVLNWKPEMPLIGGLKRTCKWFEDNYEEAIKRF